MIEGCEAERNWRGKSMAGNLSNRSSGVQIPRDICTRLKRYLYSAKCSWIIMCNTPFAYLCVNCTCNLCFASVPNLSIP